MARLVDLKTQHPGGWSDIIAALKSRFPNIETVVTDYGWKPEVWGEDKNGKKVLLAAPRLAMDFIRDREVLLWRYLECLEGAPSGIVAAQAYHALSKAGFPTPGHKDWLKPAGSWKHG